MTKLLLGAAMVGVGFLLTGSSAVAVAVSSVLILAGAYLVGSYIFPRVWGQRR